ncbi:MAG: DUF1552 domain-containing protein [Myxococcota bacterium]
MNRRQLLEFGSASLLAAPFVDLLRPTSSFAQARGKAKRLAILFSPNGTIPHRWQPTGSGRNYSFGDGSILEPLQGLEQDLLVLGGMDFNTGNNHEGGMRNMLTCGGDISIDQVIADHIGGAARFGSLELSAQTSAWGGSNQTRMCYRDGGFITPDDDPIHAWTRLFGEVGDAATQARRQSVLDLASDELKALHKRLGKAQQAQLDTHLEGLRTVERSLFGGGDCESPVAPGVDDPQNNDAFPAVADAQIDLAVQALACGVTPVVTVQLSHTVSPVVCRWVNATSGHHELSHADDGNTGSVQSFVDCEQWFAGQFRRLWEGLDAAVDPETGRPLLDDTVVLWVKELGDSRAHVCESVPWVLAGRGAGFELGRFLDVNGATHDRVLTYVAQAFGLSLGSFGTGTQGPLEVLG